MRLNIQHQHNLLFIFCNALHKHTHREIETFVFFSLLSLDYFCTEMSYNSHTRQTLWKIGCDKNNNNKRRVKRIKFQQKLCKSRQTFDHYHFQFAHTHCKYRTNTFAKQQFIHPFFSLLLLLLVSSAFLFSANVTQKLRSID